jgi:diguanylate cyclase (GGDEF)-like protein
LNIMKNYSKKLLPLLLLVLIVTGINLFFLLYYVYFSRNDAEIVNRLGIVRGSIQRATKLRLADNLNTGIVKSIDEIIENYLDVYKNKDHNDQGTNLVLLKSKWSLLKEYYIKKNLSERDRILILEISEDCWQIADNGVMYAQKDAEQKIRYVIYVLLALFVNLLFAALGIWLINRIIKEKIEFYAEHDYLTRVHNRNAFHVKFRLFLDLTKRYGRPLSLIIIDIDNFKCINDEFGHECGDIVLKDITSFISRHIRNTDELARIGGEEFAILAYETRVDEALRLAENICRYIENQSIEKAGKVTISAGVTDYREDDTESSMMKRADSAMYESKKTGKNKVSLYI